MSESDEEIYRRYLDESREEDFRILLERHRESLTLFLMGYVQSPEDAEEIMLDAYKQVTAPTYTEKGTESGECSECRKTITREIPVLRTTVKLIYLGPGFGDSYDLYQTVDSAVPSSVRGTTGPGVKTEFNGRKLLYWTCSGVRVDEGTAIVWSKAGSGFCIPDYMEDLGAGNVVYMQAVYEPLQE